MIRTDEEMQMILVDKRLAKLCAARRRKGLAQRMVVVQQILPDRLALEQRVEINLLFLPLGHRFRFRYRRRLRLRFRRWSRSPALQVRNLCRKPLRLLLCLHDPRLELHNLFLERSCFVRCRTALVRRFLYRRRKALRLRAQPRDVSLHNVDRAARLPPCIVHCNSGDADARHDEDKREYRHHIRHHGVNKPRRLYGCSRCLSLHRSSTFPSLCRTRIKRISV